MRSRQKATKNFFSCQNRKKATNALSLSKKILIIKKQFSRQKRPSKRQKVRTKYLSKFSKKRFSEQLLESVLKNIFFFCKKLFFCLAAGRSGAERRPKAYVPLHSALPPNKKKVFYRKKKCFLEQTPKVVPKIFFLKILKDP